MPGAGNVPTARRAGSRALAINVAIPEGLGWTDTRRGEEFAPWAAHRGFS